MEKKVLHRGRLIDHIGLVVRDLAVSKNFYSAVFGALKIPMGVPTRATFGQMNCSYRLQIATRCKAS